MDVADFTGGFNGWSGHVLRDIGLDGVRSDGYSVQIELKYWAHNLGYRHIEFPIVFGERRFGKSKMSTWIALEACWRVFAFRLRSQTSYRRVLARLKTVPDTRAN